MIVDSHVHLYSPDMAPKYWIHCMACYGSQIGQGRDVTEVKRRIENDWFDPTADLLIQDMDNAGIDKSVIFALDFGLSAGVDDSVSLECRYRLFADAIARHSSRLTLFGGIDPRRPDAVAFIERAVNDYGIRGVKIWPPAGVFPNDRSCYRVYEKCAQLKLPVVVHTGQEIGPLHSETCRPILVDQPASDFPEINFILAHAGMAWWEEASEMAWHHSNIYLDIAYWQSKYLRDKELFYRELRALVSLAGPGRVLFGSDWPAFRSVKAVDPVNWIHILQALPSYEGSVTFSQAESLALLGGTAEGLLSR